MRLLYERDEKTVQSGYWNLFRFDPRKAIEGDGNPFTLDSKKPIRSIRVLRWKFDTGH